MRQRKYSLTKIVMFECRGFHYHNICNYLHIIIIGESQSSSLFSYQLILLIDNNDYQSIKQKSLGQRKICSIPTI